MQPSNQVQYILDLTCSREQGIGSSLAWSRESDRECAGSVETTRVGWPSAASCTASDAALLVLPTPPLPPSMKYLRSLPAVWKEVSERLS